MGDDRRLGIEQMEQVGQTHRCARIHTHIHYNLLWALPTPLLPEGCVWEQSTTGPMTEPQVAQSSPYTVINTPALVTAS